jgi:hypothetical protein
MNTFSLFPLKCEAVKRGNFHSDFVLLTKRLCGDGKRERKIRNQGMVWGLKRVSNGEAKQC